MAMIQLNRRLALLVNLFGLVLVFQLAGCKQHRNVRDADSHATLDSLRLSFFRLPACDPDYNNLMATYNKANMSGPTIDRKRILWMYDLERRDFTQFDTANELRSMCKLFESEHVLSIVFQDFHDYKQALHVFNFVKPALEPASSFILFDRGGDGPDFWYVDGKRISLKEFEVVREKGQYINTMARDTVMYKFRIRQFIAIDTVTGLKTSKIKSSEMNFSEVK